MSARITTPTNQKLFTNISVVRMKKAGHRFEIACFKNKVTSWRTKVEKDIDEVLQIHTVYTNLSKGEAAKAADLLEAFGTDNHDEVCLQILAKGELQVSKEEREVQLSGTFREIATIVADKCVNPDTQRPYTVSQIERAMKDVHFNANPAHPAKAQAIELIRRLQENIPLQRAHMSVRIVVPAKDAKRIKGDIMAHVAAVEHESFDDAFELECAIDPGAFRTLDALIQEQTKGKGSIEILTVKNVEQGDLAL